MESSTRKKIIWFSARHAPAPVQVRELRRIWPECEIVHVKETWNSVDSIIETFHRLGGDEMFAVIPLSIVRILTTRGYSVLWSDMDQVDDNSDYDIVDEYKGRFKKYRFKGFRRLTKIKMVFEDLRA